MKNRYYKCNNCGFETVEDISTVICPNCQLEIVYSKQIEKEWINETNENGERIRVDFKELSEQDCLSRACDYFSCEKQHIDYYIVNKKTFSGLFVIRAWKYNDNLDPNVTKIITHGAWSRGWIAIDKANKIIHTPRHHFSNNSIKYSRILALKHEELITGGLYCELILEPYNKVDIMFHRNEINNVDILIDTLFGDLPQSENEMYISCFFKECDIPSNRKVRHIVINNIGIDFGSDCFIWRDAVFLCICNTVIRNGIKIKLSSISYYRIIGDKYVTTEVTGGGGGGSSVKGAIIGGIIAGGAGAVIGSRKPVESIKSSSTVHDEQKVLMYSNDSSIILKFNSEAYDLLLDLLPEKEYGHTAHETNETEQNTSPDSLDIRFKLREFKSMFDEGLITEEEYNNKKQELLSKM